MTYFRTDNTEGFTSADLATLNAACDALVSRYNADDELTQSIGDILNNVWRDGITEAELIERVQARLG